MIGRRRFLGILGGAGSAAVVGVPLISGMGGSSSTGELLPSRLPLPRPYTLPFRVPPVLRPTSTDGATDRYEIVQRTAVAEILPGVRTAIWGYNGIFPGPTFVSTSGRRTIVTHRNRLPAPVVVHLHGGRTPPEHDGYPIDLVYPEGVSGHHMAGAGHTAMTGDVSMGRRDYVYPLRQPAATLWYHDHRMDFTGPGVWRGLAGFHIVHDRHELSLGLPGGDRDVPIAIMDRSFAEDGGLRYPSLDPTLTHTPGVRSPYGPGVLGDVILVNGVPWPLAPVPAARHRLRLLNASNARRYRLVLDPPPPGGNAFVQVGTDGGLLSRPIPHDALEMAPAQRFDVVVDFGRYRPGQYVTVRNEWGDGTTADVMRFHVTARADDRSRVPDVLSTAVPLREKDAVVTRRFAFRHDTVRGMPGWTINGRAFSPTDSIMSPKLGTTEIWRLLSDFHHPIHVHLSHFQVLSRGAGGPGPYDHGPKDTVDLRPGEQMAVLVRFDDYAGRYVMHCHNLEHEDMGMMATFTTVR
ncbi:multicopper oxidase family protein [Microbispora amethystogenes]|uniref:multicopper oxidase family protein n=1 Tax=Microbispora amethystogenes TaxID=1427754 RepID=UPI0033DD55F6